MSDEITLINAKAVANLLTIELQTVYSYLHYKRFPPDIYRKIGRKPIFIKEKVLEWFLAGAKLEK